MIVESLLKNTVSFPFLEASWYGLWPLQSFSDVTNMAELDNCTINLKGVKIVDTNTSGQPDSVQKNANNEDVITVESSHKQVVVWDCGKCHGRAALENRARGVQRLA